MTVKELYQALDYVNHSREKRLQMANLILDNPGLVSHLIDIAYRYDDPISSRACWVLEFTAKEDLRYLDSHLDRFLEGIPKVHLDSSVRPIAKICEYLVLEFYKIPRERNESKLSNSHLEQISTACFDWLIGEQKVAAKAYSMTCLYYLGRTFDWIRPELKMVLENNYPSGSAAYKARARHLLARL